MFGREDAIREFLPHFFVEYVREPHESSDGVRWQDRLVPDGTWNANLLEFFWRVYPRLTESLQIPFVAKDGVRLGQTPVHMALREALVNALVHADYLAPRRIRVVKRVGGYSFSNPGSMLVAPERAFEGGESQCRNPTVHNQFMLAGLGERAGSGLPLILRAWQQQHWRRPLVAEDPDLDETRLELPTLSLFPSDVLDGLVSSVPGFSGLDETSRLTLAITKVEGHVTNRRLQELTGRHARDLTLLLRDLVAEGYLESHGDRQGTWYTLLTGLHLNESASEADQQGGSAQRSQRSSQQSSSQTSEFPRPSSGSGITRHESGLEEARHVMQVAGGSWAPREVVLNAILELCSNRFLSTRRISAELNRASATIQNNYVRRLVELGWLEPRYPDHTQHPKQAYRTTPSGKQHLQDSE
jgi:ATP-dependent DNA helicase RecG